jgi:predicted transcriptional regulator
MVETKPISFRVAAEKEQLLDQLADATERHRSWHLEKALDAYLSTQSWQIERIQTGIAQLERKEAVSHEKVEGWLSSWGDNNELEQPE